jgi:hypothetical protein
VRFINSACDLPTRQLDIVVELRPPINHNLPLAELDAFYKFVLSCTTNLDLVLRILGVNSVFVIHPPTSTIESVLGLEEGDVRIYLSPLSFVLEVQGAMIDDDCYYGFPARSGKV